MLIALGFVLVMMRQASKPEIYQSFFGALTPQNDAEPAVLTESTAAATDPSSEIDLAITAKVADGTVWRAGDFDALFLFLNDANNDLGTRAPLVEVLPLLQQPDVFRNQRITAGGTVARSQRIDASPNDFSIKEYWQLWIRPTDGADRPIVAIVQTVPKEVATVGPEANHLSGPNVLVAGRYLKRLAYQSSAGADLAPVIVGKLLETPAVIDDPRTSSLPAPASQLSTLLMVIGLAAMIGIGLAGLAMWRTAVAAKRTRQIRGLRSSPVARSIQNLFDQETEA